jgi:signal transduction histidine kinase/CheY-like chemotaxis protein
LLQYTLAELIEPATLQSLMDDFYDLTCVPVSIVDSEGRVLVGVGWQDICTKFHRVHPETCKACVESDTELSAGVLPGEFRVYKCKNNMRDIATPLMVQGQQLGNVFSGQFFFDDESIDYGVFAEQARRYGFDEREYLAAVERAPRLSRGSVETALTFFVKLAQMVSRLADANLALAQNIDERRELVRSLQHSEADLARAQGVARTGSWRLDMQTDRLVWSAEAHRIFGVPEGTPLTYELFLERVHPDDRASVNAAWRAALTGAPYDLDHRIVAGDSVKWVRELAELEFDSAGALISGFGTVQDITERKRLEEELRDKADRLAEANRLKDEFLATLSHELRTPLQAILGWSHMLALGPLEPETTQRAMASISRNAQSQAQLVADILDVSRIITGKLSIDVESVDLRPVVANAVESIRPAAAAKRLDLQVALEDRPACVSGDTGRLQQVIWNLLSNAVKFTPAGGRVSVAVEGLGSQIRIQVKDSGIGIPPAFLPYVFDRFSQVDSSTTRRHGGLGLGLAIVRHLVELHGGTVRAESEGEGRGTTFTILLPMRAIREEKSREEQAEEGEEPGSPALPLVADALKGIKVLVVDDEADARDLVRSVLARAGALVDTAGSVNEAMEALTSARYDVLCADIGMPGEDGYELIRQVRLLPAGCNGSIMAVALTAYGRAGDRARALAAGFQQHASKPVTPHDLTAAIRGLVDQSRDGALQGHVP